MKRLHLIMAFMMTMMMTFFYSGFAFAQTADPTIPVPISTNDFILYVLGQISSLKGASTIGIVLVAVQILMKLLATPILSKLNMTDGVKLLLVSFFTMVSGVTALMQGPTAMTLGAALFSSAGLTFATVFFHQIYVQFFQKSAPAAK